MPQQFVVPQFIEAEDKILGPLSIRQFAIIVGAFLFEFVLFRLAPFLWFLVIGVPLFALAMVIAFVKINGQSFHYFVLNFIQTLRRPMLRVWDKTVSRSEAKAAIEKKEEELPPPPPRKGPIGKSRLQELTLVVNTGGVYSPEDAYGRE